MSSPTNGVSREEECVRQLVQLGFDSEQIRHAWRATGATTVEAAAEYLLGDHENNAQRQVYDNVLCKMVLVVREDLGMSAGKIAAQCAHATLGAFIQAQRVASSHLQPWLDQGEPVIVCKTSPQDGTLEQIALRCASFGIPTHIVQDAGRTQVAIGSTTVLAVGPAPITMIDQVTRQLRLL